MPLPEILTAMYIALTEAGGPLGLANANQALRHLLSEGAITSPQAVAFLSSLTEADATPPGFEHRAAA